MSKVVYSTLFHNSGDEHGQHAAGAYLDEQLDAVRDRPCDLPEDAGALLDWMNASVAQVGARYRAYLGERKAGAPRRFFATRSHALNFLKTVAPTKQVDGAWLFGMLTHWDDARVASLIRIYLEELGDGMPAQNHVLLFNKLLAEQDIDTEDGLDDAHYTQGALQLALAHGAQRYLPEIIGFNLGYEQLPLHLLITAYELNELGIDPYYFTLHITVDNADSGHARKSIDAALGCLPRVGDRDAFYERMRNGYKLNNLGLGTTAIIENFDLDEAVLAIFRRKSAVGRHMHANTARVAGRTINDWLEHPEEMPQLLAGLEDMGWIKRRQDPAHSRFWQLLQADRGEMFGVFSAYEQQLIGDWIRGDTLAAQQAGAAVAGTPAQRGRAGASGLPFRTQRKMAELAQQAEQAARTQDDAGAPSVTGESDLDEDARALLAQVDAARSRDELTGLLVKLMAPATHWTPPGLLATRLYAQMLR